MKVAFLVSFPFNNRDYERFGVSILLDRGFEVEVWDCTGVFKPPIFAAIKQESISAFENVKTFKSVDILCSEIENRSETGIAVLFLGLSEIQKLQASFAKSKMIYGIAWPNAT